MTTTRSLLAGAALFATLGLAGFAVAQGHQGHGSHGATTPAAANTAATQGYKAANRADVGYGNGGFGGGRY